MMDKRITFSALILLLVMIVGIVFAAARPAIPLPLLTSTPTFHPTSTVTPNSIVSLDLPPTSTPLPLATSTPEHHPVVINIEQRVTLIPIQATLTPVPMIPLTIRQPSIAELEDYLVTNRVGVHDCPSCWASAVIPSLSAQVEMMYVDLNGDTQDDLIISDRVFSPITGYQGFVIVLLWQGDRYAEPFIVLDLSEYTSPNQRVLLEDLTGDQIPELIIDQASHYGAPGIYFVVWMRYLIQCKASCKIVWSGTMDELDEFGIARSFTLAEFQKTSANQEIPSFTIIRHGYSLPSVAHAIYHTSIHAQTMETWQWNGETFFMTDKLTLSEAHSVNYQPNLTAINQSGDQAILSISSPKGENEYPTCTFSINGKAMWQLFGCIQPLVWITWQDINQDGHEDVVITYHGQFAKLYLLAYEWDGLDVHLIADVEGKVIQTDLYGVRLENIDADSALEILAGNYELAGSNCKIADLPFLGPSEDCWYAELNFYDTFYDWNGAMYVDRGRVPPPITNNQ